MSKLEELYKTVFEAGLDKLEASEERDVAYNEFVAPLDAIFDVRCEAYYCACEAYNIESDKELTP